MACKKSLQEISPVSLSRVDYKKLCVALVVSVLIGLQSVSAQELAPDFSLRLLAGDKVHSLADYRGKVVYLDFWASWCGPCRQSLPALSRLQDELGSEQFEVLAVNLDMNPEDALAFLAEYPVSYTVLADKTGSISRVYDLVGLPSSVLIAKDGSIIQSFQGFHPSHITKLKKALGYLLE
jgi:cytochrome c biogenesis protein CcmG/thiol:disulfide interchange protein DsbE